MQIKIYRGFWLIGIWSCLVVVPLRAQTKSAETKGEIEYDNVYDDPYDINKMWIHFYPLYADAFVTNFNVGFGGQVNYYLKNKFDFRLHVRKTYAKGTDFSRVNGERNSITDNPMSVYRYGELGATYHLKDEGSAGEAKIVVYTKRYSPGKWASTIPEYIRIPAKVRKITGIRLGGYYWGSSTNLGEALDRQKVYLQSAAGDTLSTRKLYGNVQSAGIYLGGSIARIRNVVVKPKKYDIAVNDIMFTAYGDLVYAPYVSLQTVQRDGVIYPVDGVKLKNLGFRLGFEGMFNRDFSWSYGGEMGYRPSLQHRSFYAVFKVGFAFASKMQQQRNAYQVDKPE